MKRNTVQRSALMEALLATGRPMSPQELLREASRSVKGLGQATVYRNIRALMEEGALVPVDIPGEPPRYELAGKHHHHHFHCRSCNRVFEIMNCPGRMDRLTPPGFKLESHEIILRGICKTCAEE